MYKFNVILFTTLLLFVACGSNGKNESSDNPQIQNNHSSKEPRGVLTFDEYDNYTNRRSSIISVSLDTEDEFGYKVASGSMPSRHQKGKVVFREGCGAESLQLSILDTQGHSKPITPCIHNRQFSYLQSKISPDESKIFTIIQYLVSNQDSYTGSTYENKALVFDMEGNLILEQKYAISGDWLPDGRLMLSAGNGLFLLDKNLENLQRIDNNQLGSAPYNIDVSPSGKQVVFEYNEQIWIMNTDGTNLKNLLVNSKTLKYPTWSPDEQYIAYFAHGVQEWYDGYIYFFNIKEKKHYNMGAKKIFSGPLYPEIIGPLSWTQ